MIRHCENPLTAVTLCTDGTVGTHAAVDCEPRQVRKEATVATQLGALDLLTGAILSQGTADLSMSQLALARKWRPHNFNEVIGQPHVVQAFINALNNNQLHHAYLLTGTRGVGKTTLARILAKCLNCEQGISSTPCGVCQNCIEIDQGRFVDLYEVDAASRTKVEDTRELLDNVQYATTKGRYKVYLIDEVHMLSGHSFNALLKTLEEPPEHVKFILATTDPEKLPATVLSRCLQFHLMSLSPEQVAGHLETILDKEGLAFDASALKLLGKAANGSMRDALSLLDQAIAFGNNQVNTDAVRQMLGSIEPQYLYELTEALAQKNAGQVLAQVDKLASLGANFNQVLSDLSDFLHHLALHQLVPQTLFDDQERANQLAQQLQADDLQLFYQICIKGLADMALAPSARAGFEMTLLRLLAFYLPTPANQTAPHTVGADHVAPITQSVAPTTQSVAPKTNPIAPTTTNQDQSWSNLVKQLNLKGMCKILAENCAVKTMSDTHIELLLDSNAKAMLQEKHRKTINEALNAKLNKRLSLEIHVADTQINTPDAMDKQVRTQKKQAALKTIENDNNVKQIMQRFDAELDKDSIVLKDDK